jgi:ribosomal RNA-processing protein 8
MPKRKKEADIKLPVEEDVSSGKSGTSTVEEPLTEKWSKSKKKRMRMRRGKQRQPLSTADASAPTTEAASSAVPAVQTSSEGAGGGGKSKLQDAFKARLSGSRFRLLNEELYTKPSAESYQRFSEQPELYEQYHEGFRKQVEQWPVNPVDTILARIQSKSDYSQTTTVADFGCGDAALAQQLLKIKSHDKKCPYVVHSFDLVAGNELVTPCDMAKIPLSKASVDVAVFCLSLMGTNLADFLREAHRVLNSSGRLLIAEVRSRFESKDGKDSLRDFLQVLEQLGFDCVSKDTANKMFVLLDLKKNDRRPKRKLQYTAKPCIYKRR